MLDGPKAKPGAATLRPNARREAARNYRQRGWKPLPIPAGMKNPTTPEWQQQEFGDGKFALAGNIGVQFGKPSNGLCDVDLDCREARELAPYFLPETEAKFGRKSTPAAHWLYVCNAWKTARRAVTPYKDPEPTTGAEHGACMLEWRTGAISNKPARCGERCRCSRRRSTRMASVCAGTPTASRRRSR